MNIPPKYEDVVAQLEAAMGREAALRESLTDKRDEYNKLGDRYDALQQRLTVAEKRVDLLEALLKSGSSPTYAHCSAVMEALKPAAEVEPLGTRPVGCCCPPKGHTGIWAAAMCPVHFGLKRPGVKPAEEGEGS